MAERRPSAGSSALNQVDKNYKYGGDAAFGAFIPERREILRESVENQLIGYDDRGREIRQTLPAQYGESEVDFSYSPIVRGARATGSFLNDIFFGDANEQSEAAGRAVSAVRGVVGGLGDYASSQYEAGMAGGTIYDPETRQITEFDPALVMGGSGAGKSLPRSALDMSDAARMQRAQDLDFDTSRTAYRGLSGEYDPSKAGNYQMFTSSPEDASEYGSNVVSSYLRKGNNLVVDGGRNNFNSIPVRNLPDEVRANLHSSVGSVARTDDIAYAAQEAGYDSVSINNVFDKASNEIPLKPPLASNAPMSQEMMDLLDEVDASGMLNNIPDVALPPEIPRNYDPTTIDIIFDPKDVRSVSARFDPAMSDSDMLLYSGGGRQGSAIAGGSALRRLDINDLDEDQYIQAINPQGTRIAPEARPNLGMGDMYGMAPRNAEEIMTQELRSGDTVRYVQDGDSVYALGYNPDLGEEDVIGYMLGGGDGSELAVVDQMQGQGIGGNLSYLYRSQNPMAQSGGFTEAGEAAARQAYRRMMGYE